MSSTRRLLLTLAVLATMAGPACGGDPPDKEMQQAQTAIDAARVGGADLYARDEFTAAQDALKRAQDAVVQRDYRLALNNALDAREQAQAAAKTTVERKATARTDAERALAAATASLNDARAKLKAAETARASTRALSVSRRTITDGDTAVQKARTVFAQGAYLDAVSTATAATAALKAAAHDLEATTTPGAHRRH
jgi:Domain of unknown function (DUF4398)